MVAIAASVGLPLVVPEVAGRGRSRLVELPAADWAWRPSSAARPMSSTPEGVHGTVRIDGSFWNVHSAAPIVRARCVVVVSFSGMTLEVAPTAVADR